MHIQTGEEPGALDLSLADGERSEQGGEGGEDLNGDGRADATEERLEKEARSMGWRPKDEWDGPEGKWIDAKTFVERGDQILPILRANSKKMREELLTRDKELSTLRESLAAANKAIAALRKGYSESTKREVESAIADLKEQYRQAREVGDVDLELSVRDKIDTLKDKAKKIEEDHKEETSEKEDKEDKKTPELSPEFVAWQSENRWFGNTANKDDKERSDNLMKIADRLRKEGDVTVGRAFMDKCMEILEEQERGYTKPRSKVESGGGKRGVGATGRAFDNLPKEAKDVCHADNDMFVGPGKMFKTVKEWEDHYANLYQQG